MIHNALDKLLEPSNTLSTLIGINFSALLSFEVSQIHFPRVLLPSCINFISLRESLRFRQSCGLIYSIRKDKTLKSTMGVIPISYVFFVCHTYLLLSPHIGDVF